jgi:hypothetical protein
MSTKPSCQIYQIKMGRALCKEQDLVYTPLRMLLRDNVPQGLLEEAVPKPEVVFELELNRHIATAPKTPARTKKRPNRKGRPWPCQRARHVLPPYYPALEETVQGLAVPNLEVFKTRILTATTSISTQSSPKQKNFSESINRPALV